MASDAINANSSRAGPSKEIEISQTTRSSRGCLYYSNIMRKYGQNPMCLGLSRTSKPQVYVVDSEVNNKIAKNFWNFSDFKYACIGYSAHKEVSSNQTTQAINNLGELPDCVDLEFLADREPTRQAVPTGTAASPNSPSKPLEQPYREDGPNIMPKPPSSIGGVSRGGLSADEFVTRFFCTSRLVASAVVNNVGRVANNVRTTIDKFFPSDQGRPKA